MIAYVFQKYPENFAFIVYSFAAVWNLLFFKKVAYHLTVSIVF